MKIYVIYFGNHIDSSKIFKKKDDAEKCLNEIFKGKTYAELPRIEELDVK